MLQDSPQLPAQLVAPLQAREQLFPPHAVWEKVQAVPGGQEQLEPEQLTGLLAESPLLPPPQAPARHRAGSRKDKLPKSRRLGSKDM
jgi:hypothetical protein